MDVTQIIKQVTEEYAKRGITPFIINNGYCDQFANDVSERLGGKHGHFVNGLPEEFFDDGWPGHEWITYEGKHYDVDTPEGVTDWKNLRIFKRHFAKGKNKKREALRFYLQGWRETLAYNKAKGWATNAAETAIREIQKELRELDRTK